MDIRYTFELPQADELYELYDSVGWNDALKLPREVLHQAMVQSWSVVSVYHESKLVGTGRMISDGLVNAYLCGLVVDPAYQGAGLGSEMVRRLTARSQEHGLHLQLLCTEEKEGYYERLGFKRFTIGMKCSVKK